MQVSDIISPNIAICLASVIFFSTIGMKLSNYFCKLSKTFITLPSEAKRDWESRNISSLHASIISLLCVVVLIIDNDIFYDPIWGKSWKAEIIVSITVGYLISDMLYLLRAPADTTDAYMTTWVHHLLTSSIYTSVIVYGCFAYIAVVRLLAEFSTPFVNVRWILQACGMKQTRIYVINGCLMVASFFFCRIVIMPYCYIIIYPLKDSDAMKRLTIPFLCYVITAVSVDILNIYWFGRMMRGLVKYIRINTAKKQS